MIDIVLSPDPSLLAHSEPCKINADNGKPDRELNSLSKQMAKLMYHFDGVGLAAPQIGIHKRLIVIDVDYDVEDKKTRNAIVLVNPEIIEASEEMEEASEGCLSCPGVSAPVMRHVRVRVRYFDITGQEHEIEGTELLGHCLQHEIDHLNGKTLFQTCLPEARIALMQEYNEALAAGAKPGSVGQ